MFKQTSVVQEFWSYIYEICISICLKYVWLAYDCVWKLVWHLSGQAADLDKFGWHIECGLTRPLGVIALVHSHTVRLVRFWLACTELHLVWIRALVGQSTLLTISACPPSQFARQLNLPTTSTYPPYQCIAGLANHCHTSLVIAISACVHINAWLALLV